MAPCFDLFARARWRLTGADRVRYLNGQVTNDVRRIPPGGVLPACVTTAKGKLCGLLSLAASPEALWLDAEPELREPLTARLERYIVADDVTLEDVTGTQCFFHVFGQFKLQGVEIRHATRFGISGLDVTAPATDRDRILTALPGQGYQLVSEEVAEMFRIEAGVPRWGAELDEDTLPPEAGLDAFAIDYQKGCYIGQEVISRIRSVGHVNRALAGFASDSPLASGMEIATAEGKPDGRITSAARSFRLARWVALGYLKRGIPTAALHASTPRGDIVPVEIRDLPALP